MEGAHELGIRSSHPATGKGEEHLGEIHHNSQLPIYASLCELWLIVNFFHIRRRRILTNCTHRVRSFIAINNVEMLNPAVHLTISLRYEIIFA